METESLIDRLEGQIRPLFDACVLHGFIPTATDYDGNLLGMSEDCCCVELENYPTPAGGDWIVTLWFDGTARGFKRAIEQYAICFDIDEEVSLYVDNRGKNGIPSSIEALLEDAKWKKRELHDLAEIIEAKMASRLPLKSFLRDLNNRQKPQKTISTTTKDYIICSNDDVESIQEPHSWLLDGVTMCCGYDFGLDGFIESVKYCPICGRALFQKPKEK